MADSLLRLAGRLVATLLLLCRAASESAVLALGSESFASAVRAHPLLLVEFYAPWCGHCKQLEPEFEKAAAALRGRARLAKVDATLEVSLAEAYKVDGYPTLYFFKNGQPEEYGGGRSNASIVSWVEEHSGPALLVLASASALEAALRQRGLLPAFVARGGPRLRGHFAQLAEERRGAGSFLFLESPGPGSVEVHRGLGEVVELAGAEALGAAAVAEFLAREALPPFGEIGEENFASYLERATAGMLWVCFSPESFREDARRHESTFREVAAEFSQFPVVYTDTRAYEEHVREELGCTDFPTLVLQLGDFTDEAAEPGPRRYRLALQEPGLAAGPVAAWLREVLAGRVPEDEGLEALDEGLEEPEEPEEPGEPREPEL